MSKKNITIASPTYQRFLVTKEFRDAIALYPARLIEIAEKAGVNYKRLSQILNHSVLPRQNDPAVQAVADLIEFKGEILRPLPD